MEVAFPSNGTRRMPFLSTFHLHPCELSTKNESMQMLGKAEISFPSAVLENFGHGDPIPHLPVLQPLQGQGTHRMAVSPSSHPHGCAQQKCQIGSTAALQGLPGTRTASGAGASQSSALPA